MRFVPLLPIRALSIGLVVAVTTVFSGCGGDSGPDVRPIETDILKKLGKANQSQSDTAKDNKPARSKKR